MLVSSGWGQGTQRSQRELSTAETNSVEVFRSLNQLGNKDEGLKRLEEELNRSSLTFSSRRSIDSEVPLSSAPLPMPSVTSRRKKNDTGSFDGWLSTPDTTAATSSEDIFGFPGLDSDRKPKTKASWQQIYQRLKQDDLNSTGLGTSVRAGARQPSQVDDDRDLPASIKEHADKLKSSMAGTDFGSSIFKPAPSGSAFADFSGLGNGSTGQTPEQAKAHKASMENYISAVFGDSSPSTAITAIQSLGTAGSSDPLKAPVSPLESLAEPSRAQSFRPSAGMTGTLLPPTALPNVNANVLNQWNPLYTEPKLELPKAQPFFTPPMEAPRRKFF